MNKPVEKSPPHSTHNEFNAELTLGERFRRAREALNLSIEDVSQAIVLRPNLLEMIENDELINSSIPATFMKGYVRSYGKFLRLPENVWENQSFGDMPKNDLSKNARSTKVVNPYSSYHRWVGKLSILVLVIVAGMTGLWWWESYQQSASERDNLVQNYVATDEHKETENTVLATPSAQTEMVDTQANEQNPLVKTMTTSGNETNSSMSSNSAQPIQVADTNTIAESSKVESLPVKDTQVAENSAQNTAILPVVPNQAAEALTQLDSPEKANQALPDEQSAVENPSLSTPPAVAKGDLVIEIVKGSSWISVKDANRKPLAQREYKQGETLSFDSHEYAVIIGAPDNVRVTYKGENYPLKVDGRIAKFKLPKP